MTANKPSCVMRLMFLACVLAVITGCGNMGKTSSPPAPWYSAVNANGDPVFAVFEGRIPCTVSPDCNKLKVALAIYRNAQTRLPATYLLAHVGVGAGNDRVIHAGDLTITHGTVLDAQAQVYQLDANAPQELRFYWVIGQDILFILDQDMNPKVGDASYSYVLNRIKRAEGQP